MKFNALCKRLPGEETTCFGSPALEIASDGTLLAAHDYYYSSDTGMTDKGTPQPGTAIYRSCDGGESWRQIARLEAHWATFFTVGAEVYLMGCDRPFGNIVIFRSRDNGLTWTEPVDRRTGLLFPGGTDRTLPSFHCAATTAVIHRGRIFRAYEEVTVPDRRHGWKSLTVSAPVDADLLDAANWTMSNPVELDSTTFPAHWLPASSTEWLEGNVAVAPDGHPVLLLRLMCSPNADHAAMLRLSDDGRELTFDPATGYLDLPGGGHKFVVRRDPVTGFYLTMGNNNTDPSWTSQRNILSLSASVDLIGWTIIHTLIRDDSGLSWERSTREIGFQYPDFRIDGDDLIYLVRTAYDGTTCFHDANQITFHRLENFRRLLTGAE